MLTSEAGRSRRQSVQGEEEFKQNPTQINYDDQDFEELYYEDEYQPEPLSSRLLSAKKQYKSPMDIHLEKQNDLYNQQRSINIEP
jgi:hypothetical protein